MDFVLVSFVEFIFGFGHDFDSLWFWFVVESLISARTHITLVVF